jgi:two-component system, OmpR family, copper resistance phosphate regulon response regulator CusR
MRSILIVENDKVNNLALNTSLSRLGYRVKTTTTPTQAIQELKAQPFDIVLMEVNLPAKSGLEVTSFLRDSGFKNHIILMSNKNSLEDKISGFEAGADDYIVKPFEPLELQARIKSVFRRLRSQQVVLKNGNLQMDLVRREVVREGNIIELTTKEFSLLEHLMRHTEKVVDRNSIAKQVWGSEFDPDSNVIDVYINHLRKKIDTPFKFKVLKTVVGQGYLLNKIE